MILLASGAARAAQPPGAAVFAGNCAGCHGADGRGGEHAPNIAGAPAVQQLTDRALAAIVHNGIAGAGMPAFPSFNPQQVADVVAYLRILQGRGDVVPLPGDAASGQQLFFGKAHCADCHMVNGRGGFIGGDLSYYGAGVKPDVMRAVILDPEKALPADKKAVTVKTRQGETITGMPRISDNFKLSIQTLDGAYHFVPRAEIAAQDSHSLMPPASLDSKQVDDVVSYLLKTGADNSKDGSHAGKPDDDN